MSTAKIGYENYADAATLSASSQVLLAPISRLQNPHIGVKWQGTSSAEWFVVDFGAPKAIDCFRVMGLVADSCRIRYSTSDPALGDVADSGVVAVDQAFLTATELRTVTCRYVRVDLVSSTICAAGRVYAGPLHGFGVNYAWNWSRRWADLSDRKKLESGGTRINRRSKYRIFSVSFELISEIEAAGFTDDIDRICGLTDDVIFVADPASARLEQDSIFGLMVDLSPSAQAFVDRWTKPYSIEQRL